jgi:serine/threonine-protein kinase
VLEKALEKVPADRFASAAEFAAALADRRFGTTVGGAGLAAAGIAHSWRTWLRDPRSWATLVAAGVLGGTAFTSSGHGPPRSLGPETRRFVVAGPTDSSVLSLRVRTVHSIAELVVSPDGRHVAFSVNRSSGSALYLRGLDSFELFEIPDESFWPFFSPDGQSLGFFRENALWTMSIDERSPTRVAALPEGTWLVTAAAWDRHGRILIAGARGLWAVPERGGEPELPVPMDSAAPEPFEDVSVLADGRIFLGVATRESYRSEIVSPDGTERVPILPGFENVRLVDDILFFTQAGQPRATLFDVKRLVPIGNPISLAEYPTDRPGRSIAWSDGGVLELEPVRVSPSGTVTPLGLPGAYYRWPRISPDGRRLLYGVENASEVTGTSRPSRSWTSAPGRGPPSSVTPNPSGRRTDGNFSTGDATRGGLMVQVADGSLAPDTLLSLDPGDAWPTSASADGKWLVFYGFTRDAGDAGDASDPSDLQFMEIATREIRRVRIPGLRRGARFSPDGQWVAYQSTESGREEVHLRPWPTMDAQHLISNAGGIEPTWAPDGRELYYRNGNDKLVVAITMRDGTLERASPRVLFSGVFNRDQYGDQSYDVGPDGNFLMVQAPWSIWPPGMCGGHSSTVVANREAVSCLSIGWLRTS